ncbi:MAG: (deoxy)nucleoside triphosphate pyrophosphohydrolase [Spirochaetaceae bacterium]|jgi:8-oxo-dGTP diphosphatase|nr:(deoxy)nucleoside triphosphate pyrophosphohydrolase [Spirochaetaceae bacterium]
MALHRSVAGIAREGGKFFIARRVSGGDLGGKWEFPGGKVEAGESDEDALIREYDEEFKVMIQPGAFLGAVSFEHRGIIHTLNAYRIYFSGMDFTLREHTEWRWAGLEEMEKLDFAGSDRKLFYCLKSYFDGEISGQGGKGSPC